MTRIIFVRHAQADIKVKDPVLRPLTENGILTAQKLPDLFKDIEIDKFYSSPFLRSINTIKPLAERRLLSITLCPNFRERIIGLWVKNFWSYAKEQWENFDYKYYNGESLREVQERNIAELNRILKRDKGSTVLIGTHGTSLCTILNYYNLDIGYEYFKAMANKMPYIIDMIFDGMQFREMKKIDLQNFTD